MEKNSADGNSLHFHHDLLLSHPTQCLEVEHACNDCEASKSQNERMSGNERRRVWRDFSMEINLPLESQDRQTGDAVQCLVREEFD